MKRQHLAFAAVFILLTTVAVCIGVTGFGSPSPSAAVMPTIVMVHGAFADGSSWNKVIPILQQKGYKTIAVQNPLTSLEDDVAFTKRAIAEVKGPVVLVAHSWGGVVITEAGNDPEVKALVYVAAYAPDEGQSINDLNKDAYEVRKIPNVRGLMEPIVEDNFIRLKEEAVINHFAQDLPVSEAKVIAAVQGRFHTSTLSAKVTNPAWKTKPCYFVVADNDHIISPQMETEMAARLKATTVHLPSSHVAMLAKPKEVADLILKAAAAVQQ